MNSPRKFLYINPNTTQLEEEDPVVISQGPQDAYKMIALNEVGVLDPSIVAGAGGSGAGTAIELIMSEDVVGGDFISIWDDAGTPKVRKADAASGIPADGFVREAWVNGEVAEIFLSGINDALSGLTPGLVYFLSNDGGVTSTAPTGASTVVHRLGRALTPFKLTFEPAVPVIRA